MPRSSLAGDDEQSRERRERCVTILREELAADGAFWVNVHAAEALIGNVYPEGVEERISALSGKPGSSIVGISRVMARLKRKNAVLYQNYVNTIRDEFLNPGSPNRIGALESLGKLGYSERLPEIVRLADEGGSDIRGFARWVLANSGSAGDEAYLAELLSSGEQKDYFYASYALRFMSTIRPETLALLESCARRLSHDAPYRAYVASALFVHAPPEGRAEARSDLVSYAEGQKTDRYEVCEALAVRGDTSDIPFLETLLTDPEPDVRVGAANAILRIERREFRGLRWPDWGVIVLYGCAMLGIGLYFSKRQKTTDEYLVGSRQVNSFVAGISLFASFLSTISYLAIAGEIIKHGPLVFLIHIASFPVVYFITAYFFIPFFMKLPITSAYEIIEKPLGKGVRIMGSFIFLLTRFVWMALLIYLTSKALVVMLNWDERYIPLISIAGGIITVIYSTIGGLRAVLATDVTQFFILLLGAVLTVVIVTVRMGGAGAWIPTEWAPNWDRLVFFSFDPYIRLTIFFTILHIIAWWVSTAGSDQMAIQRFVATRNVKAARRTFLFTMISEKTLIFILICVGFSLLSFYRANPHYIPDGKDLITDADFLFPNFIANYMPIGISGLVIAAIFSAAMSSLSSGINSTAAVITTDIIPWLTKKAGTDFDHLRLAKLSSLVVGVLVVAISSIMGKVPGNINEVTAKTNGLFISPLFNLFCMALFVPFATPFGTVMGSIYSFAFACVVAFWDVMTGRPGITFLWIGPGSLAVGICTSLLFSLIPVKGKGLYAYIFWSVILLAPILTFYGVLWFI
ncbi:sodium/solute symporter [bacterium]|nr:sodium/solute symporter [bacterium]